MSVRKTIGLRLKNARQIYNQHGPMTQAEVAAALQIPVTTISAMESGKSQTPENLLILADYYRVNMDYVFGRNVGPMWKGRA